MGMDFRIGYKLPLLSSIVGEFPQKKNCSGDILRSAAGEARGNGFKAIFAKHAAIGFGIVILKTRSAKARSIRL
jgi:hypothetical protein